MKVISWNINQNLDATRAESIGHWLRSQESDITLLQELPEKRKCELLEHLGDGYRCIFTPSVTKHGTAVILRDQVDAKRLPDIASSHKGSVTAVETDRWGTIASVHVPNGSTYGWTKIRVCREISEWLNGREGPLLIGGDFNAPAYEGPTTTYCFGFQIKSSEEVWRDMSPATSQRLPRPASDEFERQYWKSWDAEHKLKGEDASGEVWEKYESWFYNHGRDIGMHDAYKCATTKSDSDLKGSHYAGHHYLMRYDHLFVRGYTATRAGYLREHIYRHAPATDGSDKVAAASDHAPLVVELSATDD